MDGEHTEDGIDHAFRALGRQITARRRRKATLPDDFPAFRAVVEERLKNIELQVAETKQRINAMLVMLAGTVVTALAVRVSEALG